MENPRRISNGEGSDVSSRNAVTLSKIRADEQRRIAGRLSLRFASNDDCAGPILRRHWLRPDGEAAHA